MARTRDGGTAIEPGIVARIAQGLRYAATGRAPANGPDNDAWFGPLEPLAPMAPAEVAGRQFDYPTGYNLVIQPRSHEPVTFHQLRGLADAYDLLRLVIETRKDQIARLAWTIRPRGTAMAAAPDPRAEGIRDFLAYPDREHAWDAWLRMLLEDLLVIDAPTIYPRLDNAGRLYALEPVDGATIKRVLDDAGRTPVPPAPAYQQILKGLPAIDYAADELLYLPRNPRTNRVYGFSPVEQVTMTVNIALRRQLHQLQYYTEGTVPEALIGVPETWTPDQIAQFQSYWDALLADDTASRRHARFVPATISKSFVQTKDAVLKDDYDEWLARIVCYAFSVSAQWAIRQMNRATAETAQQQAEDEGLAPLLAWVKGALDRILRQCFAAPDLEFVWLVEQDDDTLAQAQTDQVYLQSGVKTVNEIRAAQGLAPVAGGEAPLVMAGNALVPLVQAAAGTPTPSPSPHPNPPPRAGEGGPSGPGEGAVAKYSPDQSRDDDGRWTDGNGVGSSLNDVTDDDADNESDDDNDENASDGGNSPADSPTKTKQDPNAPDWHTVERPDGVTQQDWDAFKKSLDDRDDLTDTERYAFLKTFGWEGGMKVNYDDGDNTTDGTSAAGITQSTLKGLSLGVTDPTELTIGQVVAAYKAIADQATRNTLSGQTLDDLGDPQTAAQFFDVYFQHSTDTSASIIQNGINDTIGQLPPKEQATLGLGPVILDGDLGAQTRDAIASLDELGYATQLRNNVAARRAQWFGPNIKANDRLRTYGYR